MSVYVLLAIVRKRLRLEAPLPNSTDSQSDALRKSAILQALQPSDSQNELREDSNQLILFDFWRTAVALPKNDARAVLQSRV